MDLTSPFGLPPNVLWSGVFGSIIAAVIAALVAVFVVLLTNRSARRSWYDQRRIEAFEQILEAFANCWEIAGQDFDDFPFPKFSDYKRKWEEDNADAEWQNPQETEHPAIPVVLSDEEWALRVSEMARREARLHAWIRGLELPERMIVACPEDPAFDISQVSADDPRVREAVRWEDGACRRPYVADAYSDYLHEVLSQRDQALANAVSKVANKASLWRLYLRPYFHRHVERAVQRTIQVLFGEWEYSGYIPRGKARLELPPGFEEEWEQFVDAAAQWHRSRIFGKIRANKRLEALFQMPPKTRRDILADHVGAQIRFRIE